jgi:hypothetical protein
VGTFVEPAPDWVTGPSNTPVLVNVPIDQGGHVGYWRQPAVFDFLPVKETLPG